VKNCRLGHDHHRCPEKGLEALILPFAFLLVMNVRYQLLPTMKQEAILLVKP
jgi:hypothetical protein